MLRRVQSSRRSRIGEVILAILARPAKISAVLLLICAAYTFYAFSELAVEKTRISENALLPGLVDDGFADTSVILRHMGRLQERAGNRSDLMKYIYNELQNLQLETYTQGFSAKSTLVTSPNSTTSHGENVFGIVRAPRNPPFESILVVVNVDRTHLASTAFALALAGYAKKQIYWARDLVFLFVDGQNIATEAWLSAFYGIEHRFIDADELKARTGPVIGAFVLDISDVERFRAVNIKYGMVNGRLPNLDLVNLFILLVEKYGADPTLYNVAHGGTRNKYDQSSALMLFARAVIAQSFTETEGLHSILGGYGINALTLQASEREDSLDTVEPLYGAHATGGSLKTVELARVAESGMRSLNNILEKLHQSYFLYFLSHTHRFVSVAFYMPIIGLMLLPMILFALRDWLRLNYGNEWFGRLSVPTPQGDSTESPKKAAKQPAKQLNSSELMTAAFSTLVTHFISLIFYTLVVALFSLTLRDFLVSILTVTKFRHVNTVRKWLSTPTNAFTAIILLPTTVISPLALYLGRIRNDSHYYFLRFFTGCEIALLLGALSLLNFSLAFALSILFIPFAVFVMATDNTSSALLKMFGFGVLNPFSVAASLAVILERSGIATFGGISTISPEPKTINAVWKRLVRWIAVTTRNHFIHGSALLPVLIIIGLTIFHALLQIIVYENHERENAQENSKADDENENADAQSQDEVGLDKL